MSKPKLISLLHPKILAKSMLQYSQVVRSILSVPIAQGVYYLIEFAGKAL